MCGTPDVTSCAVARRLRHSSTRRAPHRRRYSGRSLKDVLLAQLQAAHENNFLRVTGKVHERADDETLDGWSTVPAVTTYWRCSRNRSAGIAASTTSTRSTIESIRRSISSRGIVRRSVNSPNRSRSNGSPPMSERNRCAGCPPGAKRDCPRYSSRAAAPPDLAVVQLR